MPRGSLMSVCTLAAIVCVGSAYAGDPIASGAASFGKPLTAEQLDQHRAGQELQLNLMDVKARLDNNQAINTLTGSNYITGEAFSKASGLPVAVQNSGNNVLIQNAFIVNMTLK